MTVSFSEKDFYLGEFRARTIAIALSDGLQGLDASAIAVVRGVLEDLQAGAVKVVLLAGDAEALGAFVGARVVASYGEGWVGALWRQLQQESRVVLSCDSDESLAACARRIALRLRVAKLVWLGEEGIIHAEDGRRVSLVDLAKLEQLAKSSPLLDEIRITIEQGLPSVSACMPAGLGDELFTYAGSGTFYSRERYIEVRPLALDEFDAAAHLIQCGVEEGYLMPRSGRALEATLANAFGAFVEGRYLAGIAALLSYPEDRAGEIACLYALTRFVGEGIGGQLVATAVEAARRRADRFVFACTTSERVETFFVRQGFKRVSPDRVPEEKWKGYAEDRLSAVRCLRIELGQSAKR